MYMLFERGASFGGYGQKMFSECWSFRGGGLRIHYSILFVQLLVVLIACTNTLCQSYQKKQATIVMNDGLSFPRNSFTLTKPDARLDEWLTNERRLGNDRNGVSFFRLDRDWHWARSVEDFEFSVRFWALVLRRTNSFSPFYRNTIYIYNISLAKKYSSL